MATAAPPHLTTLPPYSETYKGCLVVQSTDAPEDLQCYRQLSALILLVDKYQLESIAHQSTQSIKTVFTNSFKLWDTQPETEACTLRLTRNRLPDFDFGRSTSQCTSTPSVLPLALYYFALLGDKVSSGWTREGGAVLLLTPGDLARALGRHPYGPGKDLKYAFADMAGGHPEDGLRICRARIAGDHRRSPHLRIWGVADWLVWYHLSGSTTSNDGLDLKVG